MRWRLDLERAGEWAHAARRGLRLALEWWLGGLLEPLPDRWRRLLLRPCGRVLLEQRSDGWVATWSLGLPPQPSEATVALSSNEKFEAARTALGVPSAAQAVLILDSDTVLHRRLSLPAAAAPVLKNVVRNEIERLTPIPKADIALQYRIARHDRLQKRVLVDAFVTRASAVESAVAHWAERGWAIGRVTIRSRNEIESTLDFLSATHRPRARKLALPIPRWSVALVTVVAVAALYAPGLRYGALRDAHAAELAQIRATAVSARDTLTRRDDQVSRERFLAQQRAGRAPALVVLGELTRILPDHTWLQQIHVTGSRLQVQGDSTSASTVVQLLEESAIFGGAQFTAPISSTAGDNRERFVIDVAIAAQPPP